MKTTSSAPPVEEPPSDPCGRGRPDEKGCDGDRYRLPRTISPIGLFFGSGAPDPRRAPKEGEADPLPAPARRAGRAPIGTSRTRPLISMGVTIACGLFYVLLLRLPLNPQIPEFWAFLIWLCIVFAACMLFLRGSKGAR